MGCLSMNILEQLNASFIKSGKLFVQEHMVCKLCELPHKSLALRALKIRGLGANIEQAERFKISDSF